MLSHFKTLALLVMLLATAAASADSAKLVYERDVAPVFRTYCSGCHNNEDHEGDFSLETYAGLRKGADKGDPLKPGHADESLMIKLLEARAKPSMPPKDEPKVPEAELALLKRWINEGAHGPTSDQSILQQLATPDAAPIGKPSPGVTSAEYSKDGRMLAVGGYARVEIRDKSGKRVRKLITGMPGKVNAVHFSKDGSRIITASGIPGLSGAAQIWDVKSGAKIKEFKGHRDTLYDAEFSPDESAVATAGYDKSIRLWKVDGDTPLWKNSVHNGAVFDLAFSPDGRVLASASADQTIKLWRTSDGVRLDTLNQPQGEVFKVAFAPDGESILGAGADKRIHQWKFVTKEKPGGNPVIAFRFAHESAINGLSISPDGRHLVSSALDKTLKAWKLPELVEDFSYPAQPDTVTALAIAPGVERFLAARIDGSIQAFDIRSKPAQAKAQPQKTPTLANTSTNSATLAELEPNNSIAAAQPVNWPVEIRGRIQQAGDVDLFRFHAQAGQEMTLAVNAARSGSKLDSRLEILATDGKPVLQAVLQATRDSWFTFRGKDSDTSDDFRLQYWAEMELDEYLYANGEVVRLWLYPRGPDSGFKVYPGFGKRQTAFGTTAITHPLNEPTYIVKPIPAGTLPVPNGLPVFKLNYENDDDPSRQAGADSVVLFTAPTTADYVVKLSDVRGFGGETNFQYTLAVRERRPGFTIAIEGKNPKISPGSGREIRFVATRTEGFDGPIQIDLSNLPAGFSAGSPVQIDESQMTALMSIQADANAAAPAESATKAVRITATAVIQGKQVVQELGTLGDLKLGAAPKLTVAILPSTDKSVVKESPGQPLELFIHPGQSITALVRANRKDFTGRIELGNEDCGRNLPHGLYVDNIGLNGLLIVEGQTEREFVITAAKIAKPARRLFHLRATADEGQASAPVWINVLPPNGEPPIRTAQNR